MVFTSFNSIFTIFQNTDSFQNAHADIQLNQ